MNKVIASASPAINAEGLDIWLLQVPELLVGFLIVVGTTGLAVLGLVVSRRFLPPEWLKQASGKDQLFALAGRLYTVMLAFTGRVRLATIWASRKNHLVRGRRDWHSHPRLRSLAGRRSARCPAEFDRLHQRRRQ